MRCGLRNGSPRSARSTSRIRRTDAWSSSWRPNAPPRNCTRIRSGSVASDGRAILRASRRGIGPMPPTPGSPPRWRTDSPRSGDPRRRSTLQKSTTASRTRSCSTSSPSPSRRKEKRGSGSFEATKMALDSAGLTRADVDMVVCGTAPDAFDGVAMKGEYLLDGSGGYRKPYTRVFTGGGTGVFSTIAGWWHVASGLANVVLVVNEEKMSSCQPHPQSVFAHIWDPILDRPLKPNLVWIFAMEMNRYMTVYGVKKEDIARVAVKNKRNAVGHPCAQLADPNITVDDVLNSEVMAWPVQRLDISPPSDGASAIVLASEDFIRKRRITDPASISRVRM